MYGGPGRRAAAPAARVVRDPLNLARPLVGAGVRAIARAVVIHACGGLGGFSTREPRPLCPDEGQRGRHGAASDRTSCVPQQDDARDQRVAAGFLLHL
eukprot:SAG31_NODE_6934_length_1844_cov_2.869341_1_plen_98_part_00